MMQKLPFLLRKRNQNCQNCISFLCPQRSLSENVVGIRVLHLVPTLHGVHIPRTPPLSVLTLQFEF
jgi:hypothetical protein